MAGTNKTDVEQLFQEGDVVRIRTHAVSAGKMRARTKIIRLGLGYNQINCR